MSPQLRSRKLQESQASATSGTLRTIQAAFSDRVLKARRGDGMAGLPLQTHLIAGYCHPGGMLTGQVLDRLRTMSELGTRPRENLPIRTHFATSNVRTRSTSPPLPLRVSRCLHRLGDRLGRRAGRRGSQSDSEFDLVSPQPSASELMPTAPPSGGDEYSAFLGGFACFPTTPICLATPLRESSSGAGPTRPSRPLRTSSLRIFHDPSNMPHRAAHPTAASMSSTSPTARSETISTTSERQVDGDADSPIGSLSVATARPNRHLKIRPRTFLRRLTTLSDTSLHSQDSSAHGQGQGLGRGNPAVATVTAGGEMTRETAAQGASAPVLSSRFSDWSTASSSSRTPSPALSCGCRLSWWSSSNDSLHSTTSSRRIPCAEHAAASSPSGSQQQQPHEMEQATSRSGRRAVV